MFINLAARYAAKGAVAGFIAGAIAGLIGSAAASNPAPFIAGISAGTALGAVGGFVYGARTCYRTATSLSNNEKIKEGLARTKDSLAFNRDIHSACMVQIKTLIATVNQESPCIDNALPPVRESSLSPENNRRLARLVNQRIQSLKTHKTISRNEALQLKKLRNQLNKQLHLEVQCQNLRETITILKKELEN